MSDTATTGTEPAEVGLAGTATPGTEPAGTGFDLGLSADQVALADAVGGFFTDRSPIAVVRAAEPLGFDPDLWEHVRALDLPGLGVGPEHGGSGAAFADLVVVAEAAGLALAPVPLVEHLVAARRLPVDDVVSGHTVATVALRPASIEGTWSLVPAGAVAGVVVGIDGDELVAVRSSPPGRGPTNHASAPLADRSAREGERLVLGSADEFAPMLDEWRILTAAALCGVTVGALDLGVAYVLERHQFGRPIGSYQSIQHGLADIPAFIDGSRMLAHKAAWALDSGRSGTPGAHDVDHGEISDPAVLAVMALSYAAEGAAVATDRVLHYHGGYGFSREYDIQLFFRRARGWANILGDPADERLRLAELLWPAARPQGVETR